MAKEQRTECTRCGKEFVGEEVIERDIHEIDMEGQGIFEVCTNCLTPLESYILMEKK